MYGRYRARTHQRYGNRFMLVAVGWQVVIAAVLIGRDQIHLVADCLADETIERASVSVFDNLTDDITLARDGSDDRGFSAQAGNVLLLVRVAVLVLAAKTHLINFDDTHKLLEIIVFHSGAEPMADIPRGMERGPLAKEHAPKLARRNALLTLQDGVENLEPRFERNVCILEDGPNQNREPIGVSAPAGFIRALPFPRLVDVVDRLAFAAARTAHAIRPTAHHQILATGVFVGKLRHKFLEGHHA